MLCYNALGKATEDGPGFWGPAIHVGDLNEAAGFWFQPVSVLDVAANLGVN